MGRPTSRWHKFGFLSTASTRSCRKHSGSPRYSCDPDLSRTPSALRLRAALWLEMHGAEALTIALSLESAGSETPQVVARIPGQIGMRVCTCEICHRPAYACVHWG